MSKKKKKVDKEFILSSWAINNKTTMYVLITLILILGTGAYFSMPRENFPEIKETKIYISSIYPGNTAEDIEKLITDPIEDKLKTVSNVVEITSTSQEDYSIVIVEYSIDDAFKRRIRFHIEFSFPDEEQRALLWTSMMPDEADVEDDLDVSVIAKHFEMSGGYIKEATLRAAFTAAELGVPISTELLFDAARRVYREMGRLSPV